MFDFVMDNLFGTVFVGALIAGWFLLRSRATTFASASSLDDFLNSGQPLVMDFFSNT